MATVSGQGYYLIQSNNRFHVEDFLQHSCLRGSNESLFRICLEEIPAAMEAGDQSCGGVFTSFEGRESLQRISQKVFEKQGGVDPYVPDRSCIPQGLDSEHFDEDCFAPPKPGSLQGRNVRTGIDCDALGEPPSPCESQSDDESEGVLTGAFEFKEGVDPVSRRTDGNGVELPLISYSVSENGQIIYTRGQDHLGNPQFRGFRANLQWTGPLKSYGNSLFGRIWNSVESAYKAATNKMTQAYYNYWDSRETQQLRND